MGLQRTTAAVTIACLLAMGCGGHSAFMMPTTESPASLQPAAGKALVVFLRPAFMGKVIQAVVYDGEQYIGVVSRSTAVPYETKPGRHRFMVVSEAADFLDADLAANRIYYVEVMPRMGAWRARFSLRPLTPANNARDISAWLAHAKVVRPNETGAKWAERNQTSVMAKKASYEPVWVKNGGAVLLNADDGAVATGALH